jgi:hypothetical protein
MVCAIVLKRDDTIALHAGIKTPKPLPVLNHLPRGTVRSAARADVVRQITS